MYGPAFLTNESQEELRKCDSGIQVNEGELSSSQIFEPEEPADNNNSRETLFSQSPIKYIHNKKKERHSRTLSRDNKGYILRGSRTLRESSLLGESADEITPSSTPGTANEFLQVRSARRAYRFSSNHNIATGSEMGDLKEQSFYSELEVGLNNKKRPTVYDAKYWLKKVSAFMEEKKQLLERNQSSHEEIMKVGSALLIR